MLNRIKCLIKTSRQVVAKEICFALKAEASTFVLYRPGAAATDEQID